MSRHIDIEPYEKDGWYLQKRYHNSYGEVIKTTPLVSVPMAEVEPVKHGHWIKLDDAKYRCSECGKIQYGDAFSDLHYCCNCGSKNEVSAADMR